MSRIFPIIAMVTACTTGGNYPEKYASTLCETSYACLDNDDIELVSGYDNEEECVAEESSKFRGSSIYDEFEEGERSFNKDAANACLTEIEEVQRDSDCDGSMSAWTFLNDIQSDDCADVFPTVE